MSRLMRTVGGEEGRVTHDVSLSKCFYNPVYLLGFAWETDVHKQLPERNIEGVIREAKLADVRAQRLNVK